MYTVVFMMFSNVPPAAVTAAFRFSSVTRVCVRTSPSPTSLPSAPSAPVPARKIRFAWRVAHEYGPIAGGSPGGLKICFGMVPSGLRRKDRRDQRQRLCQGCVQAFQHVVHLGVRDRERRREENMRRIRPDQQTVAAADLVER